MGPPRRPATTQSRRDHTPQDGRPRLDQDRPDIAEAPAIWKACQADNDTARSLADQHADRGPGDRRRPLLGGDRRSGQSAAVFEAFTAQVLVPCLKPGDMVVLDNLSSHKSPRIRALIEGAAAELAFLPPYSPDLNPIEMIFSKIKQGLRSLGYRTRKVLWAAIEPVLDTVVAEDARNCFRHCSYTLQTV